MKQLQERNVDTLKTSMPLCFDKMFPTQGTSGFGLQYNINGIFWKQFKRAGSYFHVFLGKCSFYRDTNM